MPISSIDADTGTAGDQAFAFSGTPAAAHSLWQSVVDNGDGTFEVTYFAAGADILL